MWKDALLCTQSEISPVDYFVLGITDIFDGKQMQHLQRCKSLELLSALSTVRSWLFKVAIVGHLRDKYVYYIPQCHIPGLLLQTHTHNCQ